MLLFASLLAASCGALQVPGPRVGVPPPLTRLSATIETPVSAAPVSTGGGPGMPGSPERWVKSTKQLATVGPASSTYEMLEKLFLAGVDVFRLNFSHGAHEEKAALVEKIRALERKYSHPIAILADLQGPKLRVGVFEEDKVVLVAGQTFRLDLDDEPGSAVRVQLPHEEILETLRVGDTLLVDDGKLRLTVAKSGDGFVECVVDVGGAISNRKGVNTPSVVLPISPLTPKDRADLAFALTQPIDWVALSFVQRPEDIVELRSLVAESPRPDVRVMAKLEKPAAVEDGALEAIVDLCDGIMVARGDLGVEMNPEDVPIIQKKIVSCCRDRGKPVVVATQMLESMIESPTPTRAECSDIATAIYDGADAVMLSAESAAGLYPEESVTMQRRVISRVESDAGYRLLNDAYSKTSTIQQTSTDAITSAARMVAATIAAKCLVVFTTMGTTVRRASKGRPGVPILALTQSEDTARALALSWGVYPKVMTFDDDIFAEVLFKVVDEGKKASLLKDDADVAVVTAGLPWGTPGASNVLRVVSAAGPDQWPDVLCSPDTEECESL